MATKDFDFSIHDLIIALLRDRGVHTGHWGLTMHFTANDTSFATTGGTKLPGLAIAVSKVTLVSAEAGEEGSIDAALVNPVRTAEARSLKVLKALY